MIDFNRIAYQFDSLGNASTPNSLHKGYAPVTRVAWSCDNLPEGLTLSLSGILSGTPTIAGTYNCDINVRTNWGTATKKIRIVVENA